MPKAVPQEPTSRILLFVIRAIVACSALALIFIFAYTLFDMLNIGKPSVDTRNKAIEQVVATFSNEPSSEFLKDMSRTFTPSKTIMGKVDDLQRDPSGRIRMRGWMLDRKELGQQVFVFLIVPRKAVLMSVTGKPRLDVPKALALAIEAGNAGFDDTFDFNFNCADNNDNPPYIVALNRENEFYLVAPSIRVSGCP